MTQVGLGMERLIARSADREAARKLLRPQKCDPGESLRGIRPFGRRCINETACYMSCGTHAHFHSVCLTVRRASAWPF